jgi:hypothetical protein
MRNEFKKKIEEKVRKSKNGAGSTKCKIGPYDRCSVSGFRCLRHDGRCSVWALRENKKTCLKNSKCA